jgi:hypothetical protein
MKGTSFNIMHSPQPAPSEKAEEVQPMANQNLKYQNLIMSHKNK